MLGLLAALSCFTFAAAQSPAPSPQPPPVTNPLLFTDTTRTLVLGNYTMGYVNNTQENRCHRAVAKFQAQNTGIVDVLKMGVYSQAAPMTCGISFVLSTFPGAGNGATGVAIGNPLLTTFTDLVAATPGTDEFVKFNATPSSWSVVAGANYTVTILPFTWASSPSGGTAGGTTTHCVFQIPYGNPGLPYAAVGQYGPTAQPCGTVPWTTDLAGDGWAVQLMMNGHAAPVTVPSPSSTVTPTPTSSSTPTPSQTGTPTPSATPTGTPSNTQTPSQTPSVGSSASFSSTTSRTPTRTPSISMSPTATSSVTSSQTPTETPSPTPSLRIGASPSVTPTESPGPTDSPSPTHSPMSHTDALAAGAASVQAPSGASAGTVVGAAIGGAVLVVVAIGVAIRFKVVSAQLNTPTVSAWTPGKKKSKVRVPDFDIGLNPTIQTHPQTTNPAFSLRSLRIGHAPQPVTTV